jgi:hypothetical protein
MRVAADERQMALISRQMRGKSARQMGAVFSPYNPLGKCRRRLRGGIICRKRPRSLPRRRQRIGRHLDDVERGSAHEITVKSAPQPSRPLSVATERVR